MADKQEHSLCSALMSRPIPLLLFMRILNGFILLALFDLVPLWAISTKKLGGLELTQQDVGWMLARSAVFNIVYFLYMMPGLIKQFGNRRFGVASSLFCAILFVAMPYSPGVYSLNVCQMLIVSFACTQEIIAIACTNNAAPPGKLTAVTGVLVMSETFAKALGPVCAATGFAWTLDHWGYSGHGFVFFGLAVAHVLWALSCAALPSNIDDDAEGLQKCPQEQKMIVPDKLGKTEHELSKRHGEEPISHAKVAACEDVDDKPVAENSKKDKKFNNYLTHGKPCHQRYQKLSAADDNSSQVMSPQDSMQANEALRGA
eukprot:gnl/MRDRNA2_/MRDRNA2_159344_c0_seq1.p1 gnl/MRDRNA2_/MRDRNA2_159344_c0~~gnl/MRDRNA2_/MRDRNA2_159344_c0_seq1.p1  ORF type:complete len:338 (+),score=62.11 gnl/MRDRNA2_/MRDRNA2_159344_c0_seq1:68-1015(+)